MGPFQILLVFMLLVGIILYQIKKPSISTEESEEEKKMLLAAVPWSLLVVLTFTILTVACGEDQVGRFLLTSLIMALVQQFIPFYFIVTHPKLNRIFKRNQVLPM